MVTKKEKTATKKKVTKKTSTTKNPKKAHAQKKTTPIVTPYPQAGRKVTEFEAKLDQQLGIDNQEQKRGRGRPRKEPEPAPAEIDITVIGQTIQIPFDLWAVSQGLNGLKITDEESILIAKPAKQLIDHYLPQVPEIAWAWISLSAVSYSIMRSRLALIADVKKSKSPPNERKDAARGPVAPQGQGGPHPSAAFPTIQEIKKTTAT